MQKERPRPLDLESWKVGEREGDGERVCALPCPWPRELRQGRRAGASQQLDVLSAVHACRVPDLPQPLQVTISTSESPRAGPASLSISQIWVLRLRKVS